MKPGTGFRTAALTVAILLGLVLSVATIQAYTTVVINDPIMSPLPSRPEPLVAGGSLTVQVDADQSAAGWSARLVSTEGNIPLAAAGASYVAGKGWTVTLQAPPGLESGLYSLNFAFSESDKSVNVTQVRCVWAWSEWPTALRLTQVSDIHEPYGKDFFAVFAYETNLLYPDMLVVTGDTVDIENTASAWTNLQGTLAELNHPSYLLPGNHDYSGAKGALFKKYGGPHNYTVTVGDFLFIALSSGSEGYIDMGQLSWAEAVLAANPDKVKIVAFHHPLLSSEYEDDQGTSTGGDITGSYTDMEALSSAMYFSWQAKMTEATELLRLIETYDVRLILSGHVHRDMIYVLNGSHYFVTTTAIGGGLPPTTYHGYRLITIDTQGKVELDEYAQSRLYSPPNSVPIGLLTYVYKNANDGSGSAVSAHIVNGMEMSVDDARLEFVVSSENPAEAYSFTPEPDSYTVITTSEGNRFVAMVDVPAESELSITLSAGDDAGDPTITLDMPGEYTKEEELQATIRVEDAGWGVKSVKAWYGSGATWTLLNLPQGPTIVSGQWDYIYPHDEYSVTIPGQPGQVTLKVEAEDYAGNKAEAQITATAAQEPQAYTLSVTTQPSGVQVTVNGNPKTTPYSESLPEGTYVVEASPSATVSGKEYVFKQWSDGRTTTSRAVTLNADASLTVVYEEKQAPLPEPSGGIPVPAAFIAVGLAGAFMVARRARRG
ncbi:MAG: metallophosphoesterase [Candidatus Bathyarchaeota archaeon]